MAIDLNKLNNISKLEINESLIRGNILDNAANNMLNVIGDTYSYVVFFILFIYLFYEFYRKDGYFMYDVVRSINISSGITLIFSVVMIVLGYSSSFRVVVIFGFIFMFSLFGVYKTKTQGM